MKTANRFRKSHWEVMLPITWEDYAGDTIDPGRDHLFERMRVV
jgi:hypothetical protein